MKKNKKRTIMLVTFSLLAALAVVACNPIKNKLLGTPNIRSERNVNKDGERFDRNIGGGGRGRTRENVSDRGFTHNISTGELTTSEIDGLLFMLEEEKLAGDVYRYFYELWGDSVFQNIASSEDMHTQAVQELLETFGVEGLDSAQPGVFQNTDLQALYDQLIEQGSASQKDALLVSAAIEEIDILDLDQYLAETDNAYVIKVYENLRRGSENHLRAFVRVLENQYGETYTAAYLSMEQYEVILDGNMGMRGFRGGNNAGRNTGMGNTYN